MTKPIVIEAQKAKPVNPPLESVTITLSPRMAFLLCMVFGNNTSQNIETLLNKNNVYLKCPPFKIKKSLKGLATSGEICKLLGIYDQIKEILESEA